MDKAFSSEAFLSIDGVPYGLFNVLPRPRYEPLGDWVEPSNELSDALTLTPAPITVTLEPTFAYADVKHEWRQKTREEIIADFREVLDAAKRVPEPRRPMTVAEAEAQWDRLRGPWKPSPAQVAADILNGVTPRHRPYKRT